MNQRAMDHPAPSPTAAPRQLARNSIYNFVTQILLMLLGLWAIPQILARLSSERFGLLSLIWIIIGYLSLLDLGFTRATTKFLAETLASGQAIDSAKIFWTSLTTSLGLGLFSAGVLWLAAPYFLSIILERTSNLFSEAEQVLYFSAFALPFVFASGIVRGAQMAVQRFDLVNIFQSVIGLVQWGGSVIVLKAGFGLVEVVGLIVGSRIVSTIVMTFLLTRQVPQLFTDFRLWDRAIFRKLIFFGGWVSVSQILTPLLLYIDRFLIGAFLSLSAVAYYTIQQEVLTRTLVIPQSLTMVLFPAMSEQSSRLDLESRTANLYSRSLKYLAIVMLPIVVLLSVYAKDILTLWIGEEFAREGTVVLQILAVGLFFNALAQVPFTALHAYGHPKLPALFHIMELPLTLLLNVFLIKWMGIVGAALAWSIRALLDAFFLFGAVYQRIRPALFELHVPHWPRAALMHSAPLLACSLVSVMDNYLIKLFLIVSFMLLYMVAVWMYGFDDRDRVFFQQLQRKVFD